MHTAIFICTLLRDTHIYILRTRTPLPGLSPQSFIHPLLRERDYISQEIIYSEMYAC